MNKIEQFFDFAHFITFSTNQHGIHSPYLFQFYDEVISDKKKYPDFARLESIRSSYLRNTNELAILDLGAGSTYNNKKKKKIKSIASQQLSRSYQLRVLYRMINWLKPKNVIELGTSLGLSSFYMASAIESSEVISFEGNPDFVKFVNHQKKLHNFTNLTIIEGDFDETFKRYIDQKQNIDFAFFDGNHVEEATVRYFEWTIKSTSEEAILVFDDIHWSKGMMSAWKTIQAHPRVTATIDMYLMGIVFLRKDFKEKRHLKIRPLRL